MVVGCVDLASSQVPIMEPPDSRRGRDKPGHRKVAQSDAGHDCGLDDFCRLGGVVRFLSGQLGHLGADCDICLFADGGRRAADHVRRAPLKQKRRGPFVFQQGDLRFDARAA